jgi:hypothetical protein
VLRAARQVLVSVNPYRFVRAQLALQEEKLRLEEEALYAAQREAARAARQRKLLEVRGDRPQRTAGLLLSCFRWLFQVGTSLLDSTAPALVEDGLMRIVSGTPKAN